MVAHASVLQTGTDMALQVIIVVRGSDRVRAKLKRLKSGLYDFNNAMKEIGDKGSNYFAGQAWLSQGGVFGNKWQRLSSPYAQIKAGEYPGRGILEATGSMRKNFKSKNDQTSVLIYNKSPQFKYHQSTAPRRKLPRRQMIGNSRGFRSLVRDIIQRDIERKIRST